MTSIYFPAAALFIMLLIVIIYYNKPHLHNEETKIYSILIIISLLQCFLNCFTIVLMKKYNIVIPLLNRIDMIFIVLWLSFLLNYILAVTFNLKSNNKMFLKVLFNIGVIIIQLVLPLTIINEGEIIDTMGMANVFSYFMAAFYTILVILIVAYAVITKQKQILSSKYVPIYIFVLFMISGLFIRNIFPNIIFEPFMIAYVNLIMYFTIENPDVKMVKELQMAKYNADKANKVKAEFLASMSHEIRTPLNAIVGFCSMIPHSKTLKEAKENANDIMASSEVLLNMISNILDISAVETNSLELTEVAYNLEELIKDVINLFKYKAEEKSLDVKVEIKSDNNNLIGDAIKLKRILANLVDNAIKYTDKGEVKVNAYNKVKGNTSELKIEVIDTGIGIREEMQKKLFATFARDIRNMDSSISGMGLGLSISKSLVDFLGGTITFETKEGIGTKFTFKVKQKVKK